MTKENELHKPLCVIYFVYWCLFSALRIFFYSYEVFTPLPGVKGFNPALSTFDH